MRNQDEGAARDDATKVDPGESKRTEQIGDWAVAIDVPQDATTAHQAEAKRHRVEIGPHVAVILTRVEQPAPTAAGAKKVWDQGRDVEDLGGGKTPRGVFYAIRTETVRPGIPGHPGRHGLKPVARVYAILPLDGQHIKCTGYVERRVEVGDPDLERVTDICLSMREL